MARRLCVERRAQEGHINETLPETLLRFRTMSTVLSDTLAAFWAPEDRNTLVNAALMAYIAEMLLEENKSVLSNHKTIKNTK